MSDESKYSKQSFSAILLVSGQDTNFGEPTNNIPGQFYYILNDKDECVGIGSCLPNAGGNGASWGATMFVGHGTPKHEWTWNGSVEKPTLRPSIHRVGHWHGYLTDGFFKSEK